MMDLGGVKLGVNVDIQRTDGRVHSAVVSGTNPEERTVTVEWFERGETKGKEIDIGEIWQLNPDLQPQASVPNSNANATLSNNNNNNRPSRVVDPSKGTRRETKAKPRPSHVRVQHQNGNGNTDEQSTASENARNALKKDNGPSQKDDDKSSVATGKAGAPTAAAAKKSNVVDTIEKIQANRDKRRKQQQELRLAKVEDDMANHPNWEFLQMIRDFREGVEFKPLTGVDPVADHQICVCVRKRPLNKKETGRREIDVVTIADGHHSLVHEPRTKVDMTKYLENQTFRFDYSFDETVTNEVVYRYTARPLVDNIFQGGMSTCFAYGQTGSGKTHTMGGDFNGKNQDVDKGIYALAAKDVFRLLHLKYKKEALMVSCSFFEIYSGKVFDLLNNKQKLRVLEDGKQQVQIRGLSERVVTGVEEVLQLINHGNAVRTSGQTAANQHSSRSHAIFQIILRKKAGRKLLHGKFSLIDLAGNERGADTSSSDRQTRMEGAEINKSLLALKECIRALGRAKGAHLPFRASKLTQVLRDSFIGENSRTCMIAMISPGLSSCEHTLNTLRYADRVKELGPVGPGEAAALREGPGAGALSPTNSDLALLYTNQEEGSDLYQYQENISHLQELEEEVLDEYRNVCQDYTRWKREDDQLLAMTDEVDYDVDAFTLKLEEKVTQRMALLAAILEKVKAYRQQLQEEEKISKNITSRSKNKPTK